MRWAAGAATSGLPPSSAAWISLAVLTVTHTLSFMDRKLPFILADAIKTDLALSDTQLGIVTGAMFTVVYSTMAVPVAALLDRGSRKRIIAVAVMVWSTLTALGGLAQNFWQLCLSRIGVAAGESVLTPAANSIIGDHFPNSYRSRAIALYFLGSQFGIVIGMSLGGWINEVTSWRTAMFLLGAPGILVTLLVMFVLREPPRADARERAAGERGPSSFQVIGQMVRLAPLVHMLVGAALASLANGGMQAFLPSHVIRTFHMGTAEVGLTYGLTSAAGGFVGTMIGGFAGDWLRQRAPWSAVVLVGAGVGLAMPCIAVAVAMKSYGAFLALFFLFQLLTQMNNGPIYSTMLSLMKPNTHATAIALYLLFVSGLGMTLGPIFTGMMSDAMADKGPQASLQTALSILAIPMLWSAAHYFISGLGLRRAQRRAAAMSG